ncbi:MAG: ABC transporter ATP-binding protein [Muribaculaceae bacterium]|nr:ABC transporter ATP-binding protein [Muribaculaceae bacterium]
MSEPTHTPAMSAQELSVGYVRNGKATVVSSGISASLEPGSVTLLLGANGAGKSTLLRTLSGVQEPLSGAVRVGGKDISTLSGRQMARAVSLVYTDRTGGGGLTVEELIGLGRYPYTGWSGRLSADDKNAVQQAMESVGIIHKRNAAVATLSDGERQKAMIARALAQHTPVMLLDEPTSFLDVATRLNILSLLRRLATERNVAILLSTHDIAASLAVADFLWLLTASGEKKFIHGSCQQLINSGCMDRIFAEKNIVFNPATGDYRQAVSIDL